MSDPDGQDRIKAFYDAGVDYEWSRADRHRMEFAVSLRAITEALAAKRGSHSGLRILDVGGGPGRYSLALLDAGHRVTLLDLSPANVEFARKITGGRLEGYHCGTATDLGLFRDETFDAVLLMGPLYHLLNEVDRSHAVAEACRVLARGGLLFAGFITASSPIRDLAKSGPERAPGYFPTAARMVAWMRDGRWPAKPGSAFTDAHFVEPEAVPAFMESSGPLETISLLAAEGVVSMIEDKVNELHGPLWDYWVEVNYRLARLPSILGACNHLLYVGRKSS